jgi:iron complex outermembrane receptor protein
MVNRLPGETVVGQVNHQESYSIGSYLYGTYELSQDLRFSAGGRYTDDHKLLFRNEFLLPSRTPLIHNVKRKESWQDWSPTFNLAWDFMDGGMAYLNASHGYRAGGFNGRSARSGAVLTDEQASLEESDGLLIPYGPERLWNYELGVKTSWFDDRLTVNTSLYYIHYRNMQVRHATLDPETLAFRLLVQTADESVIQGAEIEWLAEPHERVLLDGGIALNHGRYREFDDAIPNPAFDPLDTGSDIPPTLGGGGLHLINLPMFEMNVGAQYTHPFSFGDVAARVDYSFQSRVFYSPNNSDVASQGKYGLLDGRISWRNPDDTLEFAIWGKNLLDRVYLQNASDLLGLIGIAAGQPGAPRMYGLELTYRWP